MQNWGLEHMESVFLLVQLLRALPNLSGLQIYQAPWSIVPILSYAFKDAAFPNITALCIPEHLDQVFPSFPNVTTLACPSIYAGARVLAPAKQHFPRLETLGGLRLSKELIEGESGPLCCMSNSHMHDEEVHKIFPTLRSISVSSSFPADSEVRTYLARVYSLCADESAIFQELLPLFKRFKRLSKLSLVHEDIADLLSLGPLVAGGTDVLLASGSQEKKVLRVWSYDLIQGFNVYPRVVYVA